MKSTSIEHKRENGLKEIFCRYNWVFSVLPIIFYYFFLAGNVSNIPFRDDITAAIGFVIRFDQSSSLTERLQLLVSQNNEHRVLITHLETLASFYLLGDLRFDRLVLVSNLWLLLLYIGILVALTRSERKQLALPISLLLFSYQYYAASQWYICSSSFFPVLCCMVWSNLYFQRGQYWVAFLIGMVGMYSNGNGLLILFTQGICLVFQRRFHLSLLFFLTVALYFVDFHFPSNIQYDPLFFLRNPITSMTCFFAFLGNTLNEHFYSAILLGVCCFLYGCYRGIETISKRGSADVVFDLMILQLVGTAVLATITRSVFGHQYALDSRFKVFGIIFLIVVFISIVRRVLLKDKMYFVVFGCLLFNVSSFWSSYPYRQSWEELKRVEYVLHLEEKSNTNSNIQTQTIQDPALNKYYKQPFSISK